MEILIIGCGNQGLAIAAHLSLSGVTVNMWNRTGDNISDLSQTKEICSEGVICGVAKINKISSNIDDVLTEFIIITVPTIAHNDIARMLSGRITANTIIVLSPGRTFGALYFSEALDFSSNEALPHIFEMQTIIHTARKMSSNKVHIYALKNEVLMASLKTESMSLFHLFPQSMRLYIKPVNSFIYTSLGNVGMLLHCAPTLMNIGCIESERISFKYYFDGISPSISLFLEKMDKERLSVAVALGFSLESLQCWLCRTYSVSGDTLYECLQNNLAYREIDAPATIQHRYIFEDIPCGLVPLESLAQYLSIEVPYTTLIIDLACKIMNVDYRIIGRNINKKTLYYIL
ncbi:NAD/NADP octopine/nopaline dehydrogenase family protein [Bacteroides sp.]|uniref:NAD/NADP octopine/nopaline dehydrogenase family protein n=1 Tax=Bacteroides sp. TaxID=29523 RepID=UPI002630DE9F|nr:NAD/NADP octopine/nopaline dehydrogenase family protein [Bacteroides sp.]MDD3037980.1 NAD/NADP octopine/nopaline dehydrogenase family protein [Bacteroides sp.]